MPPKNELGMQSATSIYSKSPNKVRKNLALPGVVVQDTINTGKNSPLKSGE